MATKLDRVRKIIADGQYASIDGTVVDVTTAHDILSVYDKLNGTNKLKFEKMTVSRMAHVAWKMVTK